MNYSFLLNKKMRRALTLLLYIGLTIGIYTIVCHFTHRPFNDLHLLYAVLIGCLAYLPRFIVERKTEQK